MTISKHNYINMGRHCRIERLGIILCFVCTVTVGWWYTEYYVRRYTLTIQGEERIDSVNTRDTSVQATSTYQRNIFTIRIGEKLFRLHDKNIRTVSVHPLKQQYFITASTDCHIALWDVRKLNSNGRSKSVCELPHGKGLNSAFFSPITGSKILSTCADDKLRIYQLEETAEAVADVSLASSRHHNNHTGRWLTKFRAEWHPRCEEIFIVGSMARPRQIELFDDKLHLIHTYTSEEWLGSVCSLNTFHPKRDIIAGANSSGRMHVFM
ncbi:putative WD repeat-containing protein 76 [Apostichopus japonicus]|uniref:WD repeat-containing protein 76 n=1 Tax=Stichopus japonicus TaxID=307972 RepID=A0A2G8JUZ6_STIJA|nr:putative WD repeat-containing protein 76 [Apostichopus japonicus]